MPRQPNPRNNGHVGKDLDRYKYNWLLNKGFTSSEAQEYRRAGWPKIDKALELKKQKLKLSEKEYYKRKTKKKAPKKKIKERAKEKLKTLEPVNRCPEAPPGYHYAFYKKSGKCILRKNPGKKPGTGVIKEIKHMVFIKDQTDEVNSEDFIHMQENHFKKDNEELKSIIIEWLHKDPQKGTIGRVRSYLAQSAAEEESFLQQQSGWTLILDERSSYHNILATLATVAQGVYENWRKQDYANEILFQVEAYSPRIYKKLAADDLI